MRKAIVVALSGGLVCASAVAAVLAGDQTGDPSFVNACYSLLTPDYAIAVATVYALAADGVHRSRSTRAPFP